VKDLITIGFLFAAALFVTPAKAQQQLADTRIDFFGDSVVLSYQNAVFNDFRENLSENSVVAFYNRMETAGFESLVRSLQQYKEKTKADDWLYYQLIRKAAEAVSPKKDNYVRYTLYKWYFLLKSGYDARVSVAGDTILFYVQCDENIYDIPYYISAGRQYVCLNYHDYGFNLNLPALNPVRIALPAQHGKSFSYKLTHVPDFKPTDYRYKNISFDYDDVSYHFRIKINDEVKNLYANYPVADYQLYFNAPMSRETYNSFIPALKKATKGMSAKRGVDYLMRFTRYAFLYRPDKENFGKEKRLSPEQTLLYEHSDCEDRAALFFFLVKEIYNLPMIVLAYPSHVTIAVKLDKAPGKPIIYNGEKYYICEATPQATDLNIGETSRELRSDTYEIAYAYRP
jgi:hypothetical protein